MLFAYLLLFVTQAISTFTARLNESATFSWHHIKPSKELRFHGCYDGLQSARLLLLLDWQADEGQLWSETVALAIVKVPAEADPSNPAYGGTIIIMPGGSGVEFIRNGGTHLKDVVNSSPSHPDGKSFDILDTWSVERKTYGLLDSGPQALSIHMARAKVLGALCASREHPMYYEPEKIRAYMGTVSTARDMQEIVGRIEEHRQKSTPILGLSYGTILGNTFASMYPQRVKRMVLDGVIHALDYIATGSSKNLPDAERVLRLFYQTCYEVSPNQCPLYSESGPNTMEEGVEGMLKHLRDHPIAAIVQPDDTTEVYPGLITYTDAKMLIFRALYSPIGTFPALATMFAGIRTGNYQEILGLLAIEKREHCGFRNPSDRHVIDEMEEVLPAIFCGDGENISNHTRGEFESYLRLLTSQSPTVGSIWAMKVLQCRGWRIRAKWHFTGPFGANTSTPIIWIGNTADPVTPLRNAHEMAQGFPGSVVLTQDSAGHCSVAGPSSCTVDVMKRYFAHGTLPEKGTVCPADLRPFQRI